MKNELFIRIVNFLETKTHHRYCEDGFYACPKNDDYFGLHEGTPIEKRPCNCGADEAQNILKEMERPNG